MKIGLFFLTVVLASAFSADAGMYKWTDGSGVVHFSDQPADPSAKPLSQEDLAPITEIEPSSPNPVPAKTSFPGSLLVKGTLFFDNAPLSHYTDVPASIRIYIEDLRKWVTPDYEYDGATGNFVIRNIAAGSYSCGITVDADRTNPGQFPGDYKGTAHFTALTSSMPSVRVDMERILHLLKPEDNGAPLQEWGKVCLNKIEFETPVEIAWESIGGDVTYSYTVIRSVCTPFGFKETVAADKISSSNVVLDLPPNKEGEFYTLKLEAWKNKRLIGSLMVNGKNGWGWDYRFRVIPKHGPTRVITPTKN